MVSGDEGRLRVRKVKTVTHQLVRYYRDENGRPRYRYVMGLGKHPTTEAALSAWPDEIRQLRSNGRHGRADALEAKLRRLRELVNESDEEAST